MQATELLKIQLPEALFSQPDEDTITAEYRDLAKKWHPDHNTSPQASDVFDHLTKLRAAAFARLETGSWWHDGLLHLTKKNGTHAKLHYLQHAKMDIGDAFIGEHTVLYIINKSYLYFKQNLTFNYVNSRMETEFKKYLPDFKTEFSLKGDDLVLVSPMESGFLSLRHILNKQGNLDARQAMWILSTLYNLACYLEYVRLVHHDISADNYFVEPAKHFGALIGGWWYAAKAGEKLSRVPKRTFAIMPPDVLSKKQADFRTDLESIKALGREMLGDRMGSLLPYRKDVPTALSNWLRVASTGSAQKDYTIWQKVIKDSFGERKYVVLEESVKTIYHAGN